MNGLYPKQPTSMFRAIISMFVVCLAYIGLVYTTLPFRFAFLAIAGAMALYLNYGFYGIRSAFGPLQKGATKIIVIGLIWNIIQTGLVAYLVQFVFHFSVAANGKTTIFVDNSPLQFMYHLLQIICSLLGEECLILIPSILGIYFLKKQGVSEKWSMILITLVGVFLFGMAHYSTYEGNLIQILFVTGLGRLPFNWIAFKANSIWASVIAHVFYDLPLLLVALLVAPV
ncbi:CPBP family intramembrane glutamate endopeptidase [Bacillus wiedmannii]|uniref:CPBP family intramembrane metalloprotease n=1 Tax=Bacillus wiedmannii TaxID=1890302 RepID=A0A2B6UMJ3_9BACI|nr:CPBP family intramembrane metalloprotease [Bacillus wiedmannii]MDM5265021.1 CPBP family intramembrane metalloprotease [Bacillus wiedmannii]MEE3949812.1 CPBP family intramembrane glutamate endopeptidase [Bacillus wiedmannii]PDY42737.1 CPBP family intramembrane metalloprotease [Bacillus wiedmannii]PGB60181.1 CPBP family intramembrane metalloprotease [Bacillus wiedmannii]PGD67296.1 CPBP family intramembrane metalloprotease [Bacillus wiedmannii]